MWPLIKKNIQLILAKKGTLFMLLILPVVLFSVGLLNSDTSNARLLVGVLDRDNTALSGAITRQLGKDGSVITPVQEPDVDTLLLDGKQDAVVMIPQGFEATMLNGGTPDIVIRTLQGQEVTGSLKTSMDMTLSSLAAMRDIKQITNGQALADALEASDRDGLQFSMVRITSGDVSEALSFATDFLFYVLAMSMMQATSLTMSEKHWNTLSRVRQAPVGRFAFLIASFLTAVLFLLANLVALFLITTFVLPVKTTPAMYVLWFYFGLIWIFFGIFLSLAVTSRAVYGSVLPIVTTLFAMLGGCFWPLRLMPPFMQKLAMITPHYWANDAMTLLQKGQSLFAQRTDILALTGFLVLFFAMGVFVLRRSQSVESFV